jgi:hypothetical protein
MTILIDAHLLAYYKANTGNFITFYDVFHIYTVPYTYTKIHSGSYKTPYTIVHIGALLQARNLVRIGC